MAGFLTAAAAVPSYRIVSCLVGGGQSHCSVNCIAHWNMNGILAQDWVKHRDSRVVNDLVNSMYK